MSAAPRDLPESWIDHRPSENAVHLRPPRKNQPLIERPGPWRGAVEIATGSYPSFVFGGSIGPVLPVFHVHDTTPDVLEGYLQHLVDNGYSTITMEALTRFVLSGVNPGPRRVLLCFDDAWASVWTVAFPLLRRHGLQAVTFAVPFRVSDAASPRPAAVAEGSGSSQVRASEGPGGQGSKGPTVLGSEGPGVQGSADRAGESPFATWAELRALATSGVIEVQSHSWSHSSIVASDQLRGFVTPSGPARSPFDWPLVADAPTGRYLNNADLGAPLFDQRSRLSDGVRYFDEAAREACRAAVAEGGGVAFFGRPDWYAHLRRVVEQTRGAFETDGQQLAAIREELARSRAELEHRLGTSVQHLCLPFGIAGRRTLAEIARCGYATAFSDRWFGRRAVSAGDPPFQLMRLNGRYIPCLPGRGRKSFFTAVQAS